MNKNTVIRSKKKSSNQSAENILEEHKKNIDKVIHVILSARTTLEFSAHLSQEERENRIENYKKRHKPLTGEW